MPPVGPFHDLSPDAGVDTPKNAVAGNMTPIARDGRALLCQDNPEQLPNSSYVFPTSAFLWRHQYSGQPLGHRIFLWLGYAPETMGNRRWAITVQNPNNSGAAIIVKSIHCDHYDYPGNQGRMGSDLASAMVAGQLTDEHLPPVPVSPGATNTVYTISFKPSGTGTLLGACCEFDIELDMNASSPVSYIVRTVYGAQTWSDIQLAGVRDPARQILPLATSKSGSATVRHPRGSWNYSNIRLEMDYTISAKGVPTFYTLMQFDASDPNAHPPFPAAESKQGIPAVAADNKAGYGGIWILSLSINNEKPTTCKVDILLEPRGFDQWVGATRSPNKQVQRWWLHWPNVFGVQNNKAALIDTLDVPPGKQTYEVSVTTGGYGATPIRLYLAPRQP